MVLTDLIVNNKNIMQFYYGRRLAPIHRFLFSLLLDLLYDIECVLHCLIYTEAAEEGTIDLLLAECPFDPNLRHHLHLLPILTKGVSLTTAPHHFCLSLVGRYQHPSPSQLPWMDNTLGTHRSAKMKFNAKDMLSYET